MRSFPLGESLNGSDDPHTHTDSELIHLAKITQSEQGGTVMTVLAKNKCRKCLMMHGPHTRRCNQAAGE